MLQAQKQQSFRFSIFFLHFEGPIDCFFNKFGVILKDTITVQYQISHLGLAGWTLLPLEPGTLRTIEQQRRLYNYKRVNCMDSRFEIFLVHLSNTISSSTKKLFSLISFFSDDINQSSRSDV